MRITEKKLFNIAVACIIAVTLFCFCADYIGKHPSAFDKKTPPVLMEELRELFSTRPYYSLGVNKELRGEVSVQVFFVDDDESEWDSESISLFLDGPIKEGLQFLEKQAGRYGVELKFKTQYHATTVSGEKDKLRYKGTVLDGSDGTHTHDMIEQIADNFGYYSTKEFYNSFKALSGGEVIFAAIVNRDGTSTARNQLSDYGDDYVEHTIIFANNLHSDAEIGKNSPRASTVAHEILHLFGAPDLYIEKATERYTLYKYPNDIMLLDTRNLGRLEVSEFTAYTVGWVDSPPELD